MQELIPVDEKYPKVYQWLNDKNFHNCMVFVKNLKKFTGEDDFSKFILRVVPMRVVGINVGGERVYKNRIGGNCICGCTKLLRLMWLEHHERKNIQIRIGSECMLSVLPDEIAKTISKLYKDAVKDENDQGFSINIYQECNRNPQYRGEIRTKVKLAYECKTFKEVQSKWRDMLMGKTPIMEDILDEYPEFAHEFELKKKKVIEHQKEEKEKNVRLLKVVRTATEGILRRASLWSANNKIQKMQNQRR